MAEDLIRYDILAQEALRGVVRKVLGEVVKTGLPGDHHFFISFMTRAPGVRMSERLLAQYDKEMTIVLQNQFWDLKVTDTGFEVGLSFSDVPEKLEVPFSAVRGFYDPSVNFELEFDVKSDAAQSEPAQRKSDNPPAKLPTAAAAKKPEAKPETKKKLEAVKPAPAAAAPAAEKPGKGADVVSLDAFRKK